MSAKCCFCPSSRSYLWHSPTSQTGHVCQTRRTHGRVVEYGMHGESRREWNLSFSGVHACLTSSQKTTRQSGGSEMEGRWPLLTLPMRHEACQFCDVWCRQLPSTNASGSMQATPARTGVFGGIQSPLSSGLCRRVPCTTCECKLHVLYPPYGGTVARIAYVNVQ
ncbi:hypothetical protein BAUCODRAFT_266873 [Baudoinia panamericana UAMH 10762]|uniref:Uncharacterized protein n=1 Tax=Baudoinia panamericana (strain UAMH 10762) TaxID=717646 RepID=M2N2N1_BAUPA|nr:uncharacterized protein BAUCODRAFT_266873 [Baudoinia panamericana UAMH 10762]EMC92920.1 hypothetical protein BAUCODRAFT_266873 [Baudoinia panamericana UAMH 10762]